MKRRLMYMTAFLWMAVLGKFIWEEQSIDEKIYENRVFQETWQQFDEMLQEMEAETSGCSVNLTARSDSRTGQEQRQLLFRVAEGAGILEKPSLHQEVKSNGTRLYWEMNMADATLRAEYLDLEEDYVILQMEDCKWSNAASFYMNLFQGIAEEYMLTGLPCMEVTAYLPRTLTFADKNVLSENIFYMFQAKEVEGIRGQDLYTLYGYSKLLQPYVVAGEKVMNVNLAFSALEEENKTELHLGIPVIRNNY